MKFLRAMKKLKIKQQIIAAVMACVLGIGTVKSPAGINLRQLTVLRHIQHQRNAADVRDHV